MAEIEKGVDSLPKDLEILDEDVDVAIPQEFQEGGDVNVEMMEDGGAEIDFDPNSNGAEGGEEHEANLAEFMDDGALTAVASELQESYDEMKSSRSDWEDGYLKGLDLDPKHNGINEYLGELYVQTNRIDKANERLAVLKNCNCDEYSELELIIKTRGTKIY